jgi:hypothetical protein
MDQCSPARHPTSTTGPLTRLPGHDLVIDLRPRARENKCSPAAGSDNSMPDGCYYSPIRANAGARCCSARRHTVPGRTEAAGARNPAHLRPLSPSELAPCRRLKLCPVVGLSPCSANPSVLWRDPRRPGAARDADGPQRADQRAGFESENIERRRAHPGIPPVVRAIAAIAQEADGPGPEVVLGGWAFVSWYYRIPAGRTAMPQRRELNVPLTVGRKADGTVSTIGP